jgi:glutathione peroxidase
MTSGLRRRLLVGITAMVFGLFCSSTPVKAADAHEFSFVSIDGEPLPLTQFRGKAILIVNTASQCGFTPQYEGLQTVWQRYRDRGLVVIGVPSDDFGGQEPGSNEKIKEFCEVNFNIDFPLSRKEHVVGERAHPFFRWAANELGVMAKPRWNFHKYLIDSEGRLVDWFSTVTPPTSERVLRAIEGHLPTSAS